MLLEIALVRWALEKLSDHGFRAGDPAGARPRAGAVRHRLLPDTEQSIYRRPTMTYLVGTCEVALAWLHDGRVPRRRRAAAALRGFSTCFRREAGAAGKDTRGIFRVHQFDKVEMFSFGEPDSRGRARADPGDRGGDAARARDPLPGGQHRRRRPGRLGRKKYDCEAWMPGQERYRELTCCSNTTDYQARRLDIRTRRTRAPRAAHPERHRRRRRPHDHRDHGERPARRRLGGAAGGAGAIRGAGAAARAGLELTTDR